MPWIGLTLVAVIVAIVIWRIWPAGTDTTTVAGATPSVDLTPPMPR
ncbi:MAG: hypothetical protein NWP31_03465 [Solirubrobacteraceae bacterium]|nr:hypothetical protein [Solirubrobacteraceae bacterium]